MSGFKYVTFTGLGSHFSRLRPVRAHTARGWRGKLADVNIIQKLAVQNGHSLDNGFETADTRESLTKTVLAEFHPSVQYVKRPFRLTYAFPSVSWYPCTIGRKNRGAFAFTLT